MKYLLLIGLMLSVGCGKAPAEVTYPAYAGKWSGGGAVMDLSNITVGTFTGTFEDNGTLCNANMTFSVGAGGDVLTVTRYGGPLCTGSFTGTLSMTADGDIGLYVHSYVTWMTRL